MKLLISALLLNIMLCSCKSEYHERLEQAQGLKEKMVMVEASNDLLPRKRLINEIKTLQKEIQFLAKISGNEDLFLTEVYND